MAAFASAKGIAHNASVSEAVRRGSHAGDSVGVSRSERARARGRTGSPRDACARVQKMMREQMTEHEMGELIESMADRALRVRQINGRGVPA